LAAKGKTKGRVKKKAKAKRAQGVDQRLVKALAHELRVEILTILNERMASPNELAKELNEGLSQVSYHVKVLKDYECIELVKTEPRRGAVEHYYRATSRPFVSDRDWRTLPSTVRAGLSAELLELIQADAVRSLVEGTFEAREDVHLTRTLMLLDERGWRDLMKALGDTLERVGKIQTQAATRLQGSDEDGINVSVSMLGFELPEAPSDEKAGKGKAGAKSRAKKGKAKARK
jgi:DNA-binding transcriptional ArsR family regulator